MKAFAIKVILAVMLLSLTSCGFKLRGQISSLPFETIYVSAPSGSTVGADLERAIGSNTTTRIVHKTEEADAILQVVRSSNEQRILSLSGGGRVREFELVYKLTTRLVDKEGIVIMADNTIALQRILPFLDSQILAKQAEGALLFENMQVDAVQQLIWQLAALNPE